MFCLAECLFGLFQRQRHDEYSFGRTVRLAEIVRVITKPNCVVGRKYENISYQLAESERSAEKCLIGRKWAFGRKVSFWPKVGIWPKSV